MISRKIITLVAGTLLLGSVVTANATVFHGSATGEWQRGTVDIDQSLWPAGYTGDKYGIVNMDDGVVDPLADPPPAADPGYNPPLIPTGSPTIPANNTAQFWWGDPYTGDPAPGWDKHSSPNKFDFDGVGSTGSLGVMDTDVSGRFKFGDFWYTNGDAWHARGVTAVDLAVEFYIQEINHTFTMDGTFGILNTENLGGDVDDYATIIGFQGTTEYFTYNGIDYMFTILGFSQDGGTTITTSFIAPEDTISYAALYAEIVEVPVPEPTTMVLFGVGVIGLIGARFRNRRA